MRDSLVDFIRKARQFGPFPSVAHGQAIFWGQQAGCVQGVTELTECVRTEDAWLLEVQLEMRAGNLSENNSHFLHGRPTSVPGSWLGGACDCKNETCFALSGKANIMRRECDTCKMDRKSRHRVMNDSDDKRYMEVKFARGPAVFPNNDIKCEVSPRLTIGFSIESQFGYSHSQSRL